MAPNWCQIFILVKPVQALIDSILQLVMDKTKFDQSSVQFKVSQIICLEHEETCLYGEVIQLIEERQMCWFRPICMVVSTSQSDLIGSPSAHPTVENSGLIHLHSGSDLLWPLVLFRHALDTEVISILANLNDTSKSKQTTASCRQHLNQFVKQVWAANQDKF